AFQNIYAPFDGVITARNTDVGQLIDQGSSTTQKELFHIAAIKTLRVYINVPQQYSIAAKPGLTADLTLGEYPGRRFQGTLVRTANAIDVASRTLLVEVDVNNATGELLPGAYTEVHLKLPSDIPTFICRLARSSSGPKACRSRPSTPTIKPNWSRSLSAGTLA